MAKILSLVVQNALKLTFKAPENQIFIVKRPPDLSFPSNLLLPTHLFLLLTWRNFYLNPVTSPVQILTLSMAFEKSPQLQTKTEVMRKNFL